uniref:ubiquitinyl hydrolase 1 n=1 Tax=Kalmanozyma brasiliensis (strain GHG001) TaxID=1365824 RepID=V5GGT0_KALBG
MGVQRSEFDSNSFIDNVTRPSDSAIQRSGGTNANATSVDEVETIDITIDEEDHKKVFGSQSSVPLEPTPHIASIASAPVLQDFNSHRCYLSGKHILSSPPDSIVTVIDREVLARFKENRENDPAVGLTGPETFVRALRILLRVIGNYVHGERRGAPTTSQSLGQKLGWDHLTRKIFSDLGWKEDTMPDGRDAITPPKTASSEPFSACIDLRRNTRAWIELSVWLAFHVEQLQRSRPASSVLTAPEKDLVTRVLVSSASGSIVETIGSRKDHIDGTYRKDLSRTTLEALFTLGASSTTNDQLVKFAYLINMQASNGRRALELFACLDEVYTSQRRTSRILEELLTYERSQGRYSPRDVDKAYEKLHLSVAHLGHDIERESIPIEVIVDNYKARAREVLINSDASEHAAVKDALRVIALHLGKAERLMLALDEDVDMDIEQASKMLDVNPDMDDSTVLAIFDLYVADAPARRDALRHALRAVAEHRKSEYLRHFLRTGEKDVSAAESWQQLPSNDLPAGIDNIGNTCYLNSVLQYFFSITEVRNRVLQAAATLTEPADTYQIDEDRRHDMDVDGGEESKLSSIVVNGTPHEDLLTGLFLGKTCQRIEADTIAPTNVGDQSNSSGSQGAPSRPSQPQKQTSTHIKHEVFKILPIDVLEEGRDIYDGLDGFFDSDTFVATSGAVQRRSVTLLSAPPLLQVQLQRVQYDRATMRAFKSQAHLELPEAVYMDRYMDLNADDGDGAVRIAKRLDYQAKRKQIQELRSKVAACKDGATFHLTQTLSQAANAVEELARLPPLADVAAQLDEIRAESSGPADTADPVSLSPRSQAKQAATQIQEANHGTETMADEHAAARDVASGPSEDDNSPLPPALSSLIDPGLSKLFRDESKLLREQVKEAEKQIETLKAEMASIWSDEHRFSYRLVAAFMHRGEASHGHYFLNLRGGGPESKWFKYNDSAVSATSLDQVVKDRSGATPYLVTYVREDYVGLIDPICRSIEAAQPQQQEQTSTEDQEAIAATALAGWEGGVAPDAETKEEAAETPRPQVVTDAFQVTAGETAGGKESPIKRARTDDL